MMKAEVFQGAMAQERGRARDREREWEIESESESESEKVCVQGPLLVLKLFHYVYLCYFLCSYKNFGGFCLCFTSAQK